MDDFGANKYQQTTIVEIGQEMDERDWKQEGEHLQGADGEPSSSRLTAPVQG